MKYSIYELFIEKNKPKNIWRIEVTDFSNYNYHISLVRKPSIKTTVQEHQLDKFFNKMPDPNTLLKNIL